MLEYSRVRLRGGYPIALSGESNYRDAITRACDGGDPDGVELDMDVILYPDSSNPYDANAIKVMIGQEHVGYLPREVAAACAPVLKALLARGAVGVVTAQIRGGWDYGEDDRGHYGITLDLAAPDHLIP